MRFDIPKTMKAVQQDEANGKLYITDIPVPQPVHGEVLVKMAVSPVNPSDLSLLKGTFSHKPNYPITPGIEGSGIVVASGGGLIANLRNGKRVTCSSTDGLGGTWAEYMATSAMRVIPVNTKIDIEQSSMLIVNPMTALAFMNIAKNGKHNAIVNTAAASVLGGMLINLCKRSNLPLINIVRREEQVKQLKDSGASYVLNSSAENFEEDLKALALKLEATLFFDAVAGDMTEKLVKAAPFGSKVILYSNLSEQNIAMEPRLLIQANKSIEGFFLGGWASKRSILQTLAAANQAQKLATDTLKSPIQKRFAFTDSQNAIEYYSNNMTGGKVLLTIDKSIR